MEYRSDIDLHDTSPPSFAGLAARPKEVVRPSYEFHSAGRRRSTARHSCRRFFCCLRQYYQLAAVGCVVGTVGTALAGGCPVSGPLDFVSAPRRRTPVHPENLDAESKRESFLFLIYSPRSVGTHEQSLGLAALVHRQQSSVSRHFPLPRNPLPATELA